MREGKIKEKGNPNKRPGQTSLPLRGSGKGLGGRCAYKKTIGKEEGEKDIKGWERSSGLCLLPVCCCAKNQRDPRGAPSGENDDGKKTRGKLGPRPGERGTFLRGLSPHRE